MLNTILFVPAITANLAAGNFAVALIMSVAYLGLSLASAIMDANRANRDLDS